MGSDSRQHITISSVTARKAGMGSPRRLQGILHLKAAKTVLSLGSCEHFSLSYSDAISRTDVPKQKEQNRKGRDAVPAVPSGHLVRLLTLQKSWLQNSTARKKQMYCKEPFREQRPTVTLLRTDAFDFRRNLL